MRASRGARPTVAPSPKRLGLGADVADKERRDEQQQATPEQDVGRAEDDEEGNDLVHEERVDTVNVEAPIQTAAIASAASERRSRVESRKAPKRVPPPAARAICPSSVSLSVPRSSTTSPAPGCPSASSVAPATVTRNPTSVTALALTPRA